MRLVNKGSKVPLYIQLSEIIQEMIETGELEDGSYLMPERDLCKYQNVSRMTVNKAIMRLVNEGLLSRHQGKGTFISQKRYTSRYQNVESLSEIMNKSGKKLTNVLLSFERIAIPSRVKKRLKMDDDDGFKIVRVRYVDNEPIVLEILFLNGALFPDLSRSLVENASMYELYRTHFGHSLVRAEQAIRPVMLSDYEAQLLGQVKKALALQIDRVAYSKNEEAIEYTKSIFLTGKHDFEIVLYHTQD